MDQAAFRSLCETAPLDEVYFLRANQSHETKTIED